MLKHQSSSHIHSERQRQDMECYYLLTFLALVLVEAQLLKGSLLPIAQSDSNPSLKKGTWHMFKTGGWGRSFLHLVLE